MAGLGLVSAIPHALADSTLTMWMATLQVDLKSLGYFSLALLPYSMKPIWAPLLDRYRLPLLGRRRGWMLLFLIGAIIGVVALGCSRPAVDPGHVVTLAFVIALLGASFDIVSDAYRADVLRACERTRGNAAYIIGWRVAVLFAGFGALVLAKWLSWRTIYLGLGTITLICGLSTLAASEPEPAVRGPINLGGALVQPFLEFFRRRRSAVVLAFVLLYTSGDAIAARMLPVFYYRSVGFSLIEIGTINKLTVAGATIVGAMLGGIIVDRVGVRRSIWTFGLCAGASNLLYILLAQSGRNYAVLVLVVGIDNLFGGMRTAHFGAFLTSTCDPRYSATQFAILTSASSFVGRTLSAFGGHIIEATGWSGFLAVTSAMAVPPIALFALVPTAAFERSYDRLSGDSGTLRQ